MNQEQQRFHKMVSAMEEEGDPLDAGLEDRLVHAVLDARRAERAQRRRRVGLGVAASALAACALLYLSFGDGLRPSLPSYSAEVSVQTTLGQASPAGTRLSPRSSLEVRLRPQRDPGVPMRALAFLEQGEAVRPLSVPLSVSASGALRLQTPVSAIPELVGQKGRATLVFVVLPQGGASLLGQSEPTPGAVQAALRELPSRAPAGSASHGAWQLVWHTVELE